ncbi:MAG: hypothetical protein Q9225_000248 [Loekoesia sp. 1 TL-2023]
MAGALILAVNLLIPFALLLFASGFFPYKAFLPGYASFTADQAELAQHAPFDKVIFMVVDALRRSGFEFTQRLIRHGSAIPFTAHATAPTITMPRIKAITTGSIPSFLDVILNFAEYDKSSSLENQDTWLAQLKAKPGGRLVLYGDDTWLKLFPKTFSRADGTSSFFVSDFAEVDYNVTRNVPAELENDDWSGMILHYLGLDHIGHKSGPNSPYMIPKQAEMDSVVSEIYYALETKPHLQRTLLVLCGDHGMNDAGNHGGSTEGETSPALVFISPKLRSISGGLECPMTRPVGIFDYYEMVEQSDIAPTLAMLLGFPVPKNNLGISIQSLLRFWDGGTSGEIRLFPGLLAVLTVFLTDDRIHITEQNAGQFLGLVKETFPGLSLDGYPPSEDCSDTRKDGMRLACLWSRAQNLNHAATHAGEDVKGVALRTFLKDTQSIMSSTATDYSAGKLYGGIAAAILVEVLSFVISSPVLLKKEHIKSFSLVLEARYETESKTQQSLVCRIGTYSARNDADDPSLESKRPEACRSA